MIKLIKKALLQSVLALGLVYNFQNLQAANPQIVAVDPSTHTLNITNFIGSVATFKNLYVGSNVVLTSGTGTGGFITNGADATLSSLNVGNINASGYIKINGNSVLTNAPSTNGLATITFVTNLITTTSNSLQSDINVAMTNYIGALNSATNGIWALSQYPLAITNVTVNGIKGTVSGNITTLTIPTGGGSGGGISNVVVNGVYGVLTGSGSNILSSITLAPSDVGATPNTTTITINGNTGTLNSNLNFTVTGTSTSDVQNIIAVIAATGTFYNATYANIVTGGQSNTISTALQPSSVCLCGR